MIKNFLNNRKGVTIVELLASIAILAIVILPFLSTILASVKNNQDSMEKLQSSSNIQSIMENIKSRPVFLEAQANKGFQNYNIEQGIETRYKITVVSSNELSGDALNYEFDNVKTVTYNINFDIFQNNIKLEGLLFPLHDELDEKQYHLNINGVSGSYNYSFGDGIQTKNGSFNIVGSEPIKIKIAYDILSDKNFKLYLNFNNVQDKEVYFYILDDTNSKIHLINDGIKEFYKYDNATQNSQKYSYMLYKIELQALKNGEILNTLISYVKKYK